MVAPLVAAAGITGGAMFLGGLLDRNTSRRNLVDAQNFQRSQDSTRFQTAAADAKLAGLHPLFALGAGGAGSPSFMAGQAQTGSTLGDAVRGLGSVGAAYQRSKIPKRDPLQQALILLQIENARVNLQSDRLDLTEKQRLLSGNQLVTQAGAGSREVSLPPATIPSSQAKNYQDLIEIKPHEVSTSSKNRPSETPGVEPGWDRVKMFDSLPAFFVPASDEGWAEDLTAGKLAIIAAKNGIKLSQLITTLGVKTAKQAAAKLKRAWNTRRSTTFKKPPAEWLKRQSLEPNPFR